jgi:hypothetical protein
VSVIRVKKYKEMNEEIKYSRQQFGISFYRPAAGAAAAVVIFNDVGDV